MDQLTDCPRARYQHSLKLLYSLLYYNLGGEMMYILNQRLLAQKVNAAKSSQVLSEIVNGLISHRPRTVEFCNFTSYADLKLSRVKHVFQEVLDSSSSMRLTAASFDKLFDLMVGVFKYQLVLCPMPSSLYLVTLNHLDSMRQMCKNLDEKTANRFTGYYNSFTSSFTNVSEHQWFLLRSILLTNVFATIRTRISVLLKEGLQDMETGCYTIVPKDRSYIRQVHYDENGDVVMEKSAEYDYVCDMTDLGLDIYGRESAASGSDNLEDAFGKLKMQEPRETKLLASLLGRDKESFGESSSVYLDLSFSNVIADADSREADETGSHVDDKITCNNQQINFESTKRIQPAGLDEDESESVKLNTESSEDLLALMDS